MSILGQILKLFYYLLYFLIRTFIFIGEVTTFIFLFPFKKGYFIYKSFKDKSFRIYSQYIYPQIKNIPGKVRDFMLILSRSRTKFAHRFGGFVESVKAVHIMRSSIKLFSERVLIPDIQKYLSLDLIKNIKKQLFSKKKSILPKPSKTHSATVFQFSQATTESIKNKKKEAQTEDDLPFVFVDLAKYAQEFTSNIRNFSRSFLHYLLDVLTIIFSRVFGIFPQMQRLGSDIYILFFKIIIIAQIISVAAKKWWKLATTFIINLFFLPFRLLILSVTTGFRYFYIGFAFCFIAIIIFQSYVFITSLPSPKSIGKTNYPLSTHIFDRKGRLLYEVYRDQNRTPIKLNELPPYISQASIAIEDKDFYNHKGISVIGGILRAMKDTITTNELQGGSTITQQLIKSALLTPERTIERKLKEIALALWTEQLYTKNEILEMYLNQVPYGGSSYGVEEAAKTYFGKDAKNLSIAEAAMLAGLTRAPSVYSPFVNPKLAIRRRNDVLQKMFELGYISQKTLVAEKSKTFSTITPRTNIRAPHFVFYTRAQLEDVYGIKQLEEGGFRVTTTLDLDIQQEAEKILKEELEKIGHLNVTNGGILVTKAQTGEILAMVGSVDYYASPSGAFNVTTALRQPGSSLKPFLYALALEKNYTAVSIINDSPIVFAISGSEAYKPVNYDGKFRGPVTLRFALANSLNVPAVKTINTLGVDSYVSYAQNLGIDTWNDPSRFGLSLALGGGEVMMTDVAEGFGVFANSGYRVNVTPIKKIVNNDKEIIDELNPQKEKVMDEGVAFIISDILSDNIARQAAFGPNSTLEIQGYKVAVKTGTTDEKKDNWTDGYTPDFVVSVWVGNNDNTPMNPYLASGITGAAPIWHRMMEYLLKNKAEYISQLTFIKPDNVLQKTCLGKSEYFLVGTEQTVNCQPSILKPQLKTAATN